MDAEQFAASATEAHARLTRVVFLLCGDRPLAEECAQDALVRAWQRVERGDELRSLDAWCTTVALNACRSRLRRHRAEARAVDRLPRPAEGVDDPDVLLSDDVARAVLALPLRQREVVVLHYVCDQDVAGIAALAGISTGAVKNALFHARAALAARLGTDHDPAAAPAASGEERT